MSPVDGGQPALVREDDQLGPVSGAKLHHRRADVRPRRRRADDEPLGNFLVGQSLRDQGHHLPLPIGQDADDRRIRPLRRRAGRELADHPPSDCRRKQRITAGDDADGVEDVGRLGVLPPRAVRAGPRAPATGHRRSRPESCDPSCYRQFCPDAEARPRVPDRPPASRRGHWRARACPRCRDR